MNKTQDKWEKRATVRSRPRIIYDANETGYFFPLSHQPLCLHPEVEALGEDALNYILAQSLYKYTNDIATIETRIVNLAVLSVTTDALQIKFSSDQKINLFTVMIDEAYHAYVAFDAMLQIQDHTGIKPLSLPKEIQIEKAIKVVMQKLPEKYHGVFSLMAVCLAENTLTKEIVTMIDKNETHPFFQRLIKDHLSDESRHSGIFFKLLSYIWEGIDNDCKHSITKILPEFLENYLGLDVQVEFDKQVLVHLGISSDSADEVLSDTYANFKLTSDHPMLKNILMQLEKAGVMDDIMLPIFKEKGWA
jgi:hypothetical protein